MNQIINPIDTTLLLKELTSDKFFRKTNRANNELYIIDNQSCPNVMLEIGRLREIAFRNSGGGTGKAVDIDEFDLMENSYKQLIVWNPDDKNILGGYRFQYGKNTQLDAVGQPILATSHLFHFSNKFMKEILPYRGESSLSDRRGLG